MFQLKFQKKIIQTVLIALGNIKQNQVYIFYKTQKLRLYAFDEQNCKQSLQRLALYKHNKSIKKSYYTYFAISIIEERWYVPSK